MQISNPDLYCKNVNFQNKEQAIKYMTEILEKTGYVNSFYYDEVLDRERRSSTAFEHIAVPHSMKMDACKTGMFILLNEKEPIPWGDHAVNIILLFAVNKDERAIFHDVFDNLIVLLLEKPNAAKVLRSNSYIEFIEAVIECFH